MKQPIRVLQVVTIMNLGGIENFLMNLYRNIDREKVQFDFLVHRQERGVFDDEIEAMGGKIYRLMPMHPLKFFTYRNALKIFLKNHREYKIIHSHINANSAIVLQVAKSLKIPIRIAHAHIDTTGGNHAFFKDLLRKRITRYSTLNLACAKNAGKWLFGENADFKLFNNSIDTEKFVFNEFLRNKIRQELNLEENAILIGNIARFSHQKNHEFQIRIFAEFHKIEPSAKLILVGDGELKKEIINQINNLKLTDHVILTGAVMNTNEYLNAMDIFVFPSFYEGLPVVLVETQCNGVPILMTDTISDEINLSGLISLKSLNDSPKEWAASINDLLLRYENDDRNKYHYFIKEKNYDIISNASALQNIYLSRS